VNGIGERTDFREQVALVDFRTLIHGQADHAAGNLRTHDYAIAGEDSGEQNFFSPRRCCQVNDDGNGKQHADKHKKFGHFHGARPRLGAGGLISSSPASLRYEFRGLKEFREAICLCQRRRARATQACTAPTCAI
jgi:hypothetical protein